MTYCHFIDKNHPNQQTGIGALEPLIAVFSVADTKTSNTAAFQSQVDPE